jgi:hypothetical protein
MITTPNVKVSRQLPKAFGFICQFVVCLFACLIVLNATYNNISVISWRPVLVEEEAGVHGENHQPWTSNW